MPMPTSSAFADGDAPFDDFARIDRRIPTNGIAGGLRATRPKSRLDVEDVAALQGDIADVFEPRADGPTPRALAFRTPN